MDQAARGADALKASNYAEAIKHYTAALAVNPNAVDYYVKRSTAYQRSSDYKAALADAEIAAALAYKRGKRELIKDAQLRRAIALFFLEQYANSGFILKLVKKLDEKEKTLAIWEKKVADKLENIHGDDERGQVTAKEIPDAEVPSASKPTTQAASTPTSTSTPAAPKQPAPVVQTPADKIKHDWYQNNENVYFSLLAKGVPKDKATVAIEKNSLSITFPIQASSDFDYSLDPLFAPVDPSKSTFNITPSKVEVTLNKATTGVKWKALEGDKPAEDADTLREEKKTAIPSHILNPNKDSPPSYPTSAKSGPKDWDKIAAGLKAKPEEGGESGLGDDYDDYTGDDTNRFFQHLFKGAHPEQQRAMMKSMQESGGTVLSTNWEDVGSRNVKPEPPDGMEEKKY